MRHSLRHIGLVTGARSDYGIYRPLLRRLEKDPEISLHVFVTGAHLSGDLGGSMNEIEADGFSSVERIEMLCTGGSASSITSSLGLGTIGFGQAYSRTKLDLLILLGDRFEMLAAASAALPFRIPIAHLHGGELSLGAMDDSIRHSLTKMSHLHFVSTAVARARVEQLGEEPWRITVSGAPSLDQLETLEEPSREDFERMFNLPHNVPFFLCTYHPTTLELDDPLEELFAALIEMPEWCLFTGVNADTRGRELNSRIETFASTHARCRFHRHLGQRNYFAAMRYASAMLGNSSSGIIEAPSFGLPVINIGNRQQGRQRAANVIDCVAERRAIRSAIFNARDPAFRESLLNLVNPYRQPNSYDTIYRRIREAPLGEELLKKMFREAPWS